MSWVKNFIKDLKRILNIESDRERLDQYDQLAYNIVERPKVKKMVRGYNWVYFYPVISYDKDGNEILGEQLGKILKKMLIDLIGIEILYLINLLFFYLYF